MRNQVELQKRKWSPQHGGRVEKAGEGWQAEWGRERSDRRHQSSKGLWYRVCKCSSGPFRHLGTVLVHLSIASHHYIGTTRPFMGWPLSAPSHVKCSACSTRFPRAVFLPPSIAVACMLSHWHDKTIHERTPLCSFPCQGSSCGTRFSKKSRPISASQHVIEWPWQRPFTIEPPLCSFKCSAVVKSSQEDWCSILAPQRLIMLARGHSWQDLCLLLPSSGVEPWYRGSQSSDGPP